MKKLAIASALVVLALPALSLTAAQGSAAVADQASSSVVKPDAQYRCQWVLFNGAWYCIPY